MRIKIYCDFQNADKEGNIRLNTQGTIDDLMLLDIALEPNMEILVSDGELEACGLVKFSDEEKLWVAEIDWKMIRDIGP